MSVDIDEFRRDGFARVHAAVDQTVVERACCSVWNTLKAQGVRRDDRSTWTEPVVRVRCLEDPLIEAERSLALGDAYDTLVGAARWHPPGGKGDVIPVRFPSELQPVDVGWHVEGNWKGPNEYHTDVWSTGRALFVMILLTDVGVDDAPMAMMPGSHLYVPRVLEPYGEEGLGGRAVVAALDPAILCRRVAFATGRAGDAYVCHPFLVHTATWPHRGPQPRITAIVKLEMSGGYSIDGSDISPVAKTITAGLERASGVVDRAD